MLNTLARNPIQPVHCVLALTLTTLVGCAGIESLVGPRPATLADRAEARVAKEDYTQAVQLYQRAARRAGEPQRSRYYLRAGKTATRAGDADLATGLLDRVDGNALGVNGAARLSLARLRARIVGLPPEQALQRVEPPGPAATAALAAGTWKLRAELLFDAGRVVDGVHALVQRQVWLLEPKAVRRNNARIWDALRNAPADATTVGEHRSIDTVTRGWLQLAAIDARNWPQREDLEQTLAAWAQRYPGHPATHPILPDEFGYTPDVPETVGDAGHNGGPIGLALPLSGDFATAANAIRDGFLAAYYQQSEPRADLRLYDTTTMSDSATLVQKAHADGVRILVGPLAKKKVRELNDEGNPPMPVLTLNYSDTGNSFPGFYQFGLAPEDEARAAARRAVSKGWTRGLALIPQGEWGSRVLEALRDSLSHTGGELIDYARFDPSRQDHAQPIKRVLGYNNGNGSQRKQADFIFVAAQPAEARLLRTQLRFYHATKLPVLATSHVYSGTPNPDRDSDLNGLMFTDMPWILGTHNADARKRRLSDNWQKATGGQARLFALGLDAWALIERLQQSDLRPGTLFDGATGQLYLEPDGQIRRRLDWARFAQGRPQALPPRDTIVLPGRKKRDGAEPRPTGTSPETSEASPQTRPDENRGF